jgi:hypothetical protein
MTLSQSGHGIITVFDSPALDDLDRSGELLMTKVVPVEATPVLGPLTPQGTTKDTRTIGNSITFIDMPPKVRGKRAAGKAARHQMQEHTSLICARRL